MCGAATLFWITVAPAWLYFGWRVESQLVSVMVGWLALTATWMAVVQVQTRSPALLLALMAIVWIADSAAYFAGRRFGKRPVITGSEAPTAWLVDTSAAQRLLGAPRVPLSAMLDWQADWIARGLPGLGKPTHFETRDGKY